jgi:hypothetical protein
MSQHAGLVADFVLQVGLDLAVLTKSAIVCLRTSTFIPLVLKAYAMGAYDFHWCEELRDLETSSKDNDVKFVHITAR